MGYKAEGFDSNSMAGLVAQVDAYLQTIPATTTEWDTRVETNFQVTRRNNDFDFFCLVTVFEEP